MTITWSIGVERSWKNDCREAGSLASKATVRCASSSSAASFRRSGLRPVRMTLAPSARARRAVSSPMPALPPMTTTVWPSSSGSRCVDTAVVAVVMFLRWVVRPTCHEVAVEFEGPPSWRAANLNWRPVRRPSRKRVRLRLSNRATWSKSAARQA